MRYHSKEPALGGPKEIDVVVKVVDYNLVTKTYTLLDEDSKEYFLHESELYKLEPAKGEEVYRELLKAEFMAKVGELVNTLNHDDKHNIMSEVFNTFLEV